MRMELPKIIVLAGLLFGLGAGAAAAAGFEPDFRDLALGMKASDMPTKGYDIFACGSNGGPPLVPLTGWVDYAKCAPDPNGLHEVYVAFGTRLDSMVKQLQDDGDGTPWYQKYAGTRVAGYAVVMSILFDDAGIGREFRVVTDQRAGDDERAKAFLMPLRIKGFYGFDGWTCVDRPPVDGQTPVGQVFINRLCTKTDGPKFVTVEAHLFRKKGQTGFDENGNPLPGQYESLTRLEVWDKDFKDRLAAK